MFSSFSNSFNVNKYNNPPQIQYPFTGLLNGLFNTPTAAVGAWVSGPTSNWTITYNAVSTGGVINGWAGETYLGVDPLPPASKYFMWVQLPNQANSFCNVTQNLYFPIGVYNISIWLAPRKGYYNSSMSVVVSINGTNTFVPKTFVSNTPFVNVTGTYNCSHGGTYPVVIAFANSASNDSSIFCSNFVITKN